MVESEVFEWSAKQEKAEASAQAREEEVLRSGP